MRKVLRYAVIGLGSVIVILLVCATIVGKIHGNDYACEKIYTSVPMICLWGALAVCGSAFLLTFNLKGKFGTVAIHAAFVLILCGALATHIGGIHGKIHLRMEDGWCAEYAGNDGNSRTLPFEVRLDDFLIERWEGSGSPMDYVSVISIRDGIETQEAKVSMNHIFRYRNYRFCQSGFDKDGAGSTLSVNHDPVGIGLSYTGYALLIVGMLSFFFQRKSRFRQLLAHPSLKKIYAIILICCTFPKAASAAGDVPFSIPEECAEAFGNLYVSWNGRICPMSSLAEDFTLKVHGRKTYKGLSAGQVVTGWFFRYDSWKNERFIKVKGDYVRQVLGAEGGYARISDFVQSGRWKLDEDLGELDGATLRKVSEANGKLDLVTKLCSGKLFAIFPCTNPEDGSIVWLSPGDRTPRYISYDEWAFITGSLNLVAEKVALRDWDGVTMLLGKIREYQLKKCPGGLPDGFHFKAEKLYRKLDFTKPAAMGCAFLGIIGFLLFVLWGAVWKKTEIGFRIASAVVLVWLSVETVLRWIVCGHVPLSNGFETMQFAGWCCLAAGLYAGRRHPLGTIFGLVCGGMALMVSMMGMSNPDITPLAPVLQSPLLSCHVMVIMIAYTLLAFTMTSGVAAIAIYLKDKESALIGQLASTSRILLYPAVFLLACGIFIGAVWANMSWGRYWEWDPKETWALVTMLIYSIGLHEGSLVSRCKPMGFHIFCIAAFLCVLMTYFGVNFLLGGMHSYA
ncbi:MAG: cytochrome c biogenesis protein CcsA [Candidatus Cryptobacteroides sp.]